MNIEEKIPEWIEVGPNLSFESNQFYQDFYLALKEHYRVFCNAEENPSKDDLIEYLLPFTLTESDFHKLFNFCFGWACRGLFPKNLFAQFHVGTGILLLLLQKEVYLFCKNNELDFLCPEEEFKERFTVLFS